MAFKLTVVPEKAVVVARDGTVVAASWFGRWTRRPFVYPFLAPGDVEVTRLGHPRDPVGHSHHRSIWVAHANAGGVDFWSESRDAGSIEQTGVAIEKAEGDSVAVVLECRWLKPDGAALLTERRRLAFHDLAGGELALDLGIELAAAGEPVTLEVSNFGLLGVRVARTMRVHERLGGRITNSQEAENEAGCFGQHSAWMDYSGPVPVAGRETGVPTEGRGDALPAAIAGVACFDHPRNPAEARWHVRDDGWMGPSLTRTEPITVGHELPLTVRYRLLAHAGGPSEARIGARYREWRRSVAGGD